MNEGINLPNVGWNEPRIYRGVDMKRFRSNFDYIRENERKLKAYAEKHGMSREELGVDIDRFLALAEEEGL